MHDHKYGITRAQIYQQSTNEKYLTFLLTRTGSFSPGRINNTEYLICTEDIFGGQTIIDLTNKEMASYSPGEEGYIWTDFHLSPDGKTLATIGCIWAGPFFMKFFNFTNPLALPSPEIKEIELIGNDEEIIGWIDNNNLQMKGIKRIREPEYFEGDAMRFKIISEEPMERIVNIR